MKKTEQNHRLERRLVSDLKAFKRNPRTHSSEQIAAIAASMREWGVTQPVLIDDTNTIIAGHGRVLAARSLGAEEIPVVIVGDDWSDEQKRAYVIADNKLAEQAGWDRDMLKLEFQELNGLGFDLKLTGFSTNDIGDFLNLDPADDPNDHWDGMPEFEGEELSYRHIVVHFTCEDDVKKFAQLVGQNITEDTRFLWFPEVPEESMSEKTYADASDDEPALPDLHR